jgi:hypothetical protein
MKATNENGNILVAVNEDEAIVLLEWLHRFNEQEHSAMNDSRELYDYK